MPQRETQTILIVDDTPENIDVLDGILKDTYQVKAALDGETALKIASEKYPPDLILLDVIMPKMDGYQVCRHLKQNKTTQKIPVIFVTAKKEVEDETKGFDLGAVDYITKPVEPAVVKARVKTQMELKRHRDHMEALAEERARQLIHAERLSTMGLLSAGIAHEINNPLTYIHSYAEYSLEDLQDLQSQITRISTHAKTQDIESKVKECRESMAEIIRGSTRIMSLVRNMKHFSRSDDQSRGNIDIGQCLENAMKLCQFDLKSICVALKIDDDLPQVFGNGQQIEQVLINLIKNAVDAMGPDKSAKLCLSAKCHDGGICISVEDNGPGIAHDALLNIWEAFYTTKAGEKGTGLGLAISKGIIEDHGGKIWARNTDPRGARFTMELPPADSGI